MFFFFCSRKNEIREKKQADPMHRPITRSGNKNVALKFPFVYGLWLLTRNRRKKWIQKNLNF